MWHDKFGAKDRRILMTKWAGEAWKELSKDMDLFIKLFQKSGCLITADGSDDGKIRTLFRVFKCFLNTIFLLDFIAIHCMRLIQIPILYQWTFLKKNFDILSCYVVYARLKEVTVL